jgi:hypothetical protein
VQTRPITGDEAPQQVLPQRSEAVSQLLQALQSEALRALQQPTAYDDELFKQATGQAQQLLDERYGALQRQLEADLARRGLDYGSTAGQQLADLATQRGRAFQEILTPLLRERAQALGQGREAAANIARGLLGFRTGLEAQERGELRGERSYLDALREAAREQALQQFGLGESALQQALSQALGVSDPTALLQTLGSSASGLGNVAGAYGEQAAQGGQQLGDLATLIAQLLAQRGNTSSSPGRPPARGFQYTGPGPA